MSSTMREAVGAADSVVVLLLLPEVIAPLLDT
jgi:hypothetical protein